MDLQYHCQAVGAIMNYSFFLDETGDHGLTFVDKNFPIFLLCGCLISETSLKKLEKSVKRFKRKYFSSTDVILHSRDIRKCEGSFQILFDLDLKARFYADLNTILGSSQFCIIGAGVHKERHLKRYGKVAHDPYSLCLSFVLERLVYRLNRMDTGARVEIFVEQRGKREDQALLAHFNAISDRGTYYVASSEFKTKFRGFGFYSKGDNIIGLQIADLCAYPLARHLINPKAPYVPFEVVKDKIDCSPKGIVTGWGLKVFP
jgi:hypothetical protein